MMLNKIILCLALLLLTVPGHAQFGQAWFLFSNFAADAGTFDVYFDRVLLYEGLAPLETSPDYVIDEGVYYIDLVPAGQSPADSRLTLPAVELLSGHYYRIAVLGQAADNSLHIRLVDETLLMSGLASAESAGFILYNNLAGAPALRLRQDGELIGAEVAPNDVAAFSIPPTAFDELTAVNAANHELEVFDMLPADGFYNVWEPYRWSVGALLGTYPGVLGSDYAFIEIADDSLVPDAVELLRSYTGRELFYGRSGQGYYDFGIFLSLIEISGMADYLTSSSAFALFAPTDKALSQLPPETLDALRADPDLARQFVRNHMTYYDIPYLSDIDSFTTMEEHEYHVEFDADARQYRLNDTVLANEIWYYIGLAYGYEQTVWILTENVLLPDS